MISVLNRRVAPVLLLLQVAYIGLFTLLVMVLPPDTAELDHTDPAPWNPSYAAILFGIVVALVGAAAILALDVIRARAPRAVRVGWLGAVALGQLVLAARALVDVRDQSPGPDMVFGVAMAVASLGVAAACAVEARVSPPTPARAARSAVP
jgi:hypothetical protein